MSMIASLLLMGAQAAPLFRMIGQCPAIAESQGGCGDLVLPVWRQFTAANGEVVRVDSASVEPLQGGVAALVYFYVPGTRFDEHKLSTMLFNCAGGFSASGHGDDWADAPPRSLIGEVARYACQIGDKKRHTQQ